MEIRMKLNILNVRKCNLGIKLFVSTIMLSTIIFDHIYSKTLLDIFYQ